MEKTLTAPRCDQRQAPIQRNANTGDIRDPRPARDVAAGECWAFTEHRSVGVLIAEGLL
jgi:hypothetical protein